MDHTAKNCIVCKKLTELVGDGSIRSPHCPGAGKHPAHRGIQFFLLDILFLGVII